MSSAKCCPPAHVRSVRRSRWRCTVHASHPSSLPTFPQFVDSVRLHLPTRRIHLLCAAVIGSSIPFASLRPHHASADLARVRSVRRSPRLQAAHASHPSSLPSVGRFRWLPPSLRRFRLLLSVHSSPASAVSHRDRVADSLHVSLLTPHLPTTWHAPSVRGFPRIHWPHTSRPSSLHPVPQLPGSVNVVRSRAPFAAHVRCTRSLSRLRFRASDFSALPTPTVSSIASTSVCRWCTFADSARVASVDRFHRSRSVHTSQPSPLRSGPPVRRFRRLHSDHTSRPTPSPHRCASITVASEKSL